MPDKVRVERAGPLVAFVKITAAGVSLPDFQQRVWDRAAFFVQHAPGHDDALADGFAARAGIAGQVGVLRHYPADIAGRVRSVPR